MRDVATASGDKNLMSVSGNEWYTQQCTMYSRPGCTKEPVRTFLIGMNISDACNGDPGEHSLMHLRDLKKIAYVISKGQALI